MKTRDARSRVNRDLQDFFGMVFRDFFNFHAPFSGGHDGQARGRAVHQQAQIQLARDIAAIFNINARHQLAGGAGLLRHQRLADHRISGGLHIGGGFHHAHAALAIRVFHEAARAATTRMDL